MRNHNEDKAAEKLYAAMQGHGDLAHLLESASTTDVDTAILMYGGYFNYGIHYAFSFIDDDTFKALVKKASPKAINQALVLQNHTGWTVFSLANLYKKREKFDALVEKASPTAINQALVLQGAQGVTGLEIAARYQQSESFKALVEKASPEAINQALVLQGDDGLTAFHAAAHSQSPESFKALIKAASPDAVSQALVMKNNLGFTGLEVAARYQQSESFKALVEKASPEAINQALVLQGDDGLTAFHTAAYSLSPESFKALIKAASPAAINQALILKGNRGLTGIKAADQYQSSESFKELVEKASAFAIATAIFNNPNVNQYMKDANVELIKNKLPFFLELLGDLSAIKNNAQKFIELHKKILNDFDEKILTLTDCKLWILYLNRLLIHAPNEETKNLIEASCMRLNWIASFKTKNIADSNKFKEKSRIHLSKITSPHGLSVSENYLAFELISEKQKVHNFYDTNKIEFLHQAVIDLKNAPPSEKEKHTNILMLLSSMVLDALDVDLNIPYHNLEEWTNEDEDNYQKVVGYYSEVKGYLNSIEKFITDFDNEVLSSCTTEEEKMIAKDFNAALTADFNSIKSVRSIPEIRDKIKKFQLNYQNNDAKNQLINIIKNDIKKEKIITFFKNLSLCIATAPLLVGLVFAGVWAYRHAKTKEHLFFTDNIKNMKKNKSTLEKLSLNTPQKKS